MFHRARIAGVALAVPLTFAGCGLVFQGFDQDVTLNTNPPGASLLFADRSVVSPAVVRVLRRDVGHEVLRAELPGYFPACALVPCGRNTALTTLDAIPLAIPLLLDSALGTLRNCQAPRTLDMIPLPRNAVIYELPGDEILWEARRKSRFRVDICQNPYLYDEAFGREAARIIVTAGDLNRAYEILGSVDFTAQGSDVTYWSGFYAGRVSYTRGWRRFTQATLGEVNAFLRRYGLLKFGKEIDAIINVAYETNPRNDVSATGLAVRFQEDSSGARIPGP